MKASELRALARKRLKGNWGFAAGLTIVYIILSMIISGFLGIIPFIGQIASIAISPVLSFGILVSFIKLAKNQDPSFFGFLKDGFDSFGKVWGVTIQTLLKLLLPILLTIGSIILSGFSMVLTTTNALTGDSSSSLFGIIVLLIYPISLVWLIIKSFSYSLTLYILNDEPNLSSKEIVNKSEELMKGNKWRYFCLSLSFIGWAILSGLTFGIGLLWLIPYIYIASYNFYEELVYGTLTNNTDYDSLA